METSSESMKLRKESNMDNKSRIQKGARFVNYLVGRFKDEVDIHTHATKGSGNGLDKSDIAIPGRNIRIEAKNAAQVTLITDWEQTKAQAFHDQVPILIVRHPKKAEFRESLVVMDLEAYIVLLQEQGEKSEVQAKFNYKQTSALNSLKTAMSNYERNEEDRNARKRVAMAITQVRKEIPDL